MIDVKATRPRGGQGREPIAAAADDVLFRLALWLADVAAEAVVTARVLETNARLPNGTPEPRPSPVVAR